MPTDLLSRRVRLTCDELEQRIRQMHAGVPLPPMPDLRRELSCSQETLVRAYQQLEARGLISRKKGKGVFVADRLQTGEFAIVMRPALLGQSASPYYRTVSSHIIRLLQGHNTRWQVRMHCGQQTETGPAFPQTLDLLQPDVLPRLRGAFSFHNLREVGQAVEDAGVPVVHLGQWPGRAGVAFDQHGDFLRRSIGHLRDVGRCRTIGLIVFSRPKDGRFVQRFRAVAHEMGFALRPEWIVQEETESTERTGYEAFMRFWSGAGTRPDGVVVADDVMCNGVLRGTLQLGVRMPLDLRLITFACRGIDLAYHVPVSRVEYDMQELAERAVGMMLDRLRGGAVPRATVLLAGRTIDGTTT